MHHNAKSKGSSFDRSPPHPRKPITRYHHKGTHPITKLPIIVVTAKDGVRIAPSTGLPRSKTYRNLPPVNFLGELRL